jgi:membrane protein implicated in regulation of membrane protease activity
LVIGSPVTGLLGAGLLALVYLALLRGWLKSRFTVKHQVSNADAVIGKTGVVTKRIAARTAGLVKLGDEVWRAELSSSSGEDSERAVGATVTVDGVEGVTLKVR